MYSEIGVCRGIHFFSSFLNQNTDCGYLLKLSRRVINVLSKNIKIIKKFSNEIFIIFESAKSQYNAWASFHNEINDLYLTHRTSASLFDAQPYMAMYSLRKLAHAIYSDFFSGVKIESLNKNFDIFLMFAQNIDFGYEYPQSMFNKKIGIPLHTPVLLYKSGV